jgi:hypothetical protein
MKKVQDFLALKPRFSLLANLDDKTRSTAEQIIKNEVAVVTNNSSMIKGNGCAACHVLFKVKEVMQVSEQDAADLLSEVLLDNAPLNEQFISMVEDIHMKQRMMGVAFAIKTREAKDRYIDSQFKNSLDELLADTANYGVDIVLRKLIMSHIALGIAQNLGIDYHAATEELYYYMRKRDEETHAALKKLIQSIVDRSKYR